MNYNEKCYEEVLEETLLESGYIKSEITEYHKARALFPEQIISFIQSTQPKEWEYLYNLHKENTGAVIIEDLGKALNSEYEGCLYVLRHGFKCYGKTLKTAYFAPVSNLNPEIQRLYDANRLSITRQLMYSEKNNNSLDMVISLNGIPIITLELKNPLTGQTWRNAIHQYKHDRDPGELLFQFKKRTLAHFAADPDEIYMTTRLSGKETRFLPFNKGLNQGAGNPPNPKGYKTAYLAEEILQKDSLLEIIARFLHLQVEEKMLGTRKIRRESLIFPRYHQLDCVRRIITDAGSEGSGKSYLIQHSAGSGKSNTIAWLAHRLASLHNEQDKRVFDSVVVVTDRLVLDQQLQDTIYQFEHKYGVVCKINEDSTQLAECLKNGTPIIITTLQKFPYVTEKVGALPQRKYAVIIDEAHSSQSGERATELKGVLGENTNREVEDYEDVINQNMQKRGHQPNISFFAFTATPKYKTLEVFGTAQKGETPASFHIYSMRQAIEEGFIHDVLKYYTTYKTYFGLIKSIEDDPEVDKHKAARELARFMSMHPYNISQKTEVMIEHFRRHTRHKIGGKAKAMVVTSSRLHAVRYKQSFDEYLLRKGYTDIRTLVAFSGEVIDPDAPDCTYTEQGMNQGVREKELPERFGSDEYQILIVAEKYQTGFDQPLLHTMYVDKRLDGIQAVQTLSRLNRIHSGKEDTFVLDFYNESDGIAEAFQPYFETTKVGERVDVHQLYEIKIKLEAAHVFFTEEVEEFARTYYKPVKYHNPQDHVKLNRCLDPAVERYLGLSVEEQDEFKRSLTAFRNLYSFISQIIPFQDSDLEKLYTYVRFLIAKLPKGAKGIVYHFDDEVALKYYRLQKIMEGSITLETGIGGEVSGPLEVGTGKVKGELVELSELINILNERFGTNFTTADQLFFDSLKEDALANDKLRQAAVVNTLENFGIVFQKQLEDILINRLDQNQTIAQKFFNEDDFKRIISHTLMKQVYKAINEEKV